MEEMNTNRPCDPIWATIEKQEEAEIEHQKLMNLDYNENPHLLKIATECHDIFWNMMKEKIAQAIISNKSSCEASCGFSTNFLMFDYTENYLIGDNSIKFAPPEFYSHIKSHQNCEANSTKAKISRIFINHFNEMLQETIANARQEYENRTGNGSLRFKIRHQIEEFESEYRKDHLKCKIIKNRDKVSSTIHCTIIYCFKLNLRIFK